MPIYHDPEIDDLKENYPLFSIVNNKGTRNIELISKSIDDIYELSYKKDTETSMVSSLCI